MAVDQSTTHQDDTVTRRAPEEPEQRRERVLLVDDEPLVREVVSQTLRDSGYDVLEASNGFDAMTIAANGSIPRIELLITDVVMPFMRGDELAGKIRQIYPDVKVIYVTGYGQCSVNPDHATPSDIVLEKPFAPSTLVSTIRGVLERP